VSACFLATTIEDARRAARGRDVQLRGCPAYQVRQYRRQTGDLLVGRQIHIDEAVVSFSSRSDDAITPRRIASSIAAVN
jgi:hypothetical protein